MAGAGLSRRADAAKECLRESTPLAETAPEAGFAGRPIFTRTVKAAFGMTSGRHVRLCTGLR